MERFVETYHKLIDNKSTATGFPMERAANAQICHRLPAELGRSDGSGADFLEYGHSRGITDPACHPTVREFGKGHKSLLIESMGTRGEVRGSNSGAVVASNFATPQHSAAI